MRRGRTQLVWVMASSLGVLACCAAPAPRTTLYTAEDMEASIGTLADALGGSRWLAGRSPESPELRLAIGNLENRSSTRLSSLDRRAMVTRVLLTPEVHGALAERNVRLFMLPADARSLEAYGITPGEQWAAADPTHAVDATFSSAARAGRRTPGRPADARKDYYLITMRIVDLSSREEVWSGTAEFARAARGTLVD